MITLIILSVVCFTLPILSYMFIGKILSKYNILNTLRLLLVLIFIMLVLTCTSITYALRYDPVYTLALFTSSVLVSWVVLIIGIKYRRIKVNEKLH